MVIRRRRGEVKGKRAKGKWYDGVRTARPGNRGGGGGKKRGERRSGCVRSASREGTEGEKKREERERLFHRLAPPNTSPIGLDRKEKRGENLREG